MALKVGHHRSKMVSIKHLTVHHVRSAFCSAFNDVCLWSKTGGSFLFSSTSEHWNTWFGLLFTARCFSLVVEDSRAVLWAAFKGSSDQGLRKLVRDIADSRGWCTIDHECRGLDLSLVDGHSDGICAAEFEASTIVAGRGEGEARNLDDLVKLMKRPFPFRIFHGRANRAINRAEDARKHDLAKEKASEILYANRANIWSGDQVFISIATTSGDRSFRHAIGCWKPAESDEWPHDDTLWEDLDTRL